MAREMPGGARKFWVEYVLVLEWRGIGEKMVSGVCGGPGGLFMD